MIDIEKIIGKVSNEIKKGSTRIVYFPINKRKIILDGIETEIETVLKVAKPHTVEFYSESNKLGKFQNKTETSLKYSQYNAFIVNSDNTYFTNYSGILSPIISHYPDYSWVEMVRVKPMTIRDFCIETTTEDYPAGLYFSDVELCMRKFFSLQEKVEGEIWPEYISTEKYEFIIKHPWINSYFSLLNEINLISVDFTLENLGYIEHPLTKKKIIVLCDYGCTKEYKNFSETL